MTSNTMQEVFPPSPVLDSMLVQGEHSWSSTPKTIDNLKPDANVICASTEEHATALTDPEYVLTKVVFVRSDGGQTLTRLDEFYFILIQRWSS
jgi:hypothetical protein